jgi:hypothetical protein
MIAIKFNLTLTPWFSIVISAKQTVPRLTILHLLLYRHSGLDPESSAVPRPLVSGCRVKSGMTGTQIIFAS